MVKYSCNRKTRLITPQGRIVDFRKGDIMTDDDDLILELDAMKVVERVIARKETQK